MEQILFGLYEPKSKLFIKKNGVTKYWSCSDHVQRAFAALTSNPVDAYLVSSDKEAREYLKTIAQVCGYAFIGTCLATVERDDFLGCKIDNSALCVIINMKWLVVQKVACAFKVME